MVEGKFVFALAIFTKQAIPCLRCQDLSEEGVHQGIKRQRDRIHNFNGHELRHNSDMDVVPDFVCRLTTAVEFENVISH